MADARSKIEKTRWAWNTLLCQKASEIDYKTVGMLKGTGANVKVLLLANDGVIWAPKRIMMGNFYNRLDQADNTWILNTWSS